MCFTLYFMLDSDLDSDNIYIAYMEQATYGTLE